MHPRQNPVAARADAHRQLLLRIPRRRLNQRGDRRGFFGSYFRCGLAEVAIRGGLDAIEAFSQVDLVQIGFEDRRFRIAPLEAAAVSISRSLRLTVLSRSPLVMRTNCCVIVLPPCTMRRARRFATPEAARRDEVVAVMLIEPPILRGEHRRDKMRRNAAQRDIDPPFGEQREHLTIVDVIQRRRLRARLQREGWRPRRKPRTRSRHRKYPETAAPLAATIAKPMTALRCL